VNCAILSESYHQELIIHETITVDNNSSTTAFGNVISLFSLVSSLLGCFIFLLLDLVLSSTLWVTLVLRLLLLPHLFSIVLRQ